MATRCYPPSYYVEVLISRGIQRHVDEARGVFDAERGWFRFHAHPVF